MSAGQKTATAVPTAAGSARKRSGAGRRPEMTSWLAIAVASVVALGLIWTIISTSLVASLASSHPELSLAVAPDNPVALLNLVERDLVRVMRSQSEAASTKPEHHTDVAKEARARLLADVNLSLLKERVQRALAREPLSARGVRMLAQIAELEGRQEHALDLYDNAARRSKHEPIAVFHATRRAFDRKDYARALELGETLLRTRPDLATFVYPMLASLAESEAGLPLLLGRLAQSPPWRADALTGLFASVTDPRTPLHMMLALKERGAPSTTAEVRSYLNLLVGRGLHELAYYVWLQMLPPEELGDIRAVHNGRFQAPITSFPFDWVLKAGSGATHTIVRPSAPGGDAGLRVDFEAGRADIGTVAQRLMLAEGSYRFKVRYKGELVGRRGLKWTISCAAQSQQALGETAMFVGRQLAWAEASFELTVPAEGCRSQILRLLLDARSASEQLVVGSVLYDELEITRREQ